MRAGVAAEAGLCGGEDSCRCVSWFSLFVGCERKLAISASETLAGTNDGRCDALTQSDESKDCLGLCP